MATQSWKTRWWRRLCSFGLHNTCICTGFTYGSCMFCPSLDLENRKVLAPGHTAAVRSGFIQTLLSPTSLYFTTAKNIGSLHKFHKASLVSSRTSYRPCYNRPWLDKIALANHRRGK
ncbi:hypothetical protein P167DRAFT_430318 [Morchella conica CCBAS932]|uniref:Uncharacterized protein n=1 Tax=Morchella conica CCBAS932 TaxID=1392247 RepID=A0A3N4KY10_9PEZI|nr:hypothetical protein P167DRAFT_430318 [Morchella conica CCBAS932]